MNAGHPTRTASPRQQGMALLVVLAILTVMVTVALEMNRQGRNAVLASAAGSRHVQTSQMHESGLQAAMAILTADRLASETDSLQEEWADNEAVGRRIGAMVPFEQGRLSVEIRDELGRLQVNALVQRPGSPQTRPDHVQVLERLVAAFKSASEAESEDVAEAVDVQAVTNSMIDWLDGGDDDAVTGLSGAESEYYEGLDPAYPCRNGAIPHLSELLRIKGVTPALFEGSDGAVGLSRLLTADGPQKTDRSDAQYDGRININTAETAMIMALLPPEDQWFLEALDIYRTEQSEGQYVNDISDPSWYRGLAEWGQLDSDKQKQFEALITTQSDLFRVTTTADLDGQRTRGIGIVERLKDAETGKWRCRLIRWETRPLAPEAPKAASQD